MFDQLSYVPSQNPKFKINPKFKKPQALAFHSPDDVF